MKIKKFKEAISGWELIGKDMGLNYPQQNIPNTISTHHTEVVLGIDGNLYTHDDYQSLYQDYLKSGGTPLNGFSKGNLDVILST